MGIFTIYKKNNRINKGQVYIPYIGRERITGFPLSFKNLQIPDLFAKTRS